MKKPVKKIKPITAWVVVKPSGKVLDNCDGSPIIWMKKSAAEESIWELGERLAKVKITEV